MDPADLAGRKGNSLLISLKHLFLAGMKKVQIQALMPKALDLSLCSVCVTGLGLPLW